MAATIEQSIDFDHVTPEELFEVYMDPTKHTQAIGAPVEMAPEVGGRFSAFGGVVGRNLLIEPQRTIVQTWRASVWGDDDPDSVLVLTFTKIDQGARVQLVQANVPDHAKDTIDQGWHLNYWRRWAQYFTRNK